MLITAGEYEATKAKVAKILDRATKRGFTGALNVEATEVEVKETNDLGFETVEIRYDVRITGDPPRYPGGWELLAKLTWDEEAGLITRNAPGVDKVDRDGLREGWCDHCRTHRHRNNTYLVGKGRQTLQVGSSCIKDFLGWSANVVWFSSEDAAEEVEGFLGGGGYFEQRWPVETVLAAAWAAIQVDGFQPASSYGATTKGTVRLILDPRTKWDRKEVEKYRPYVERSYAQGKIIRDFILSDAFSGDSDYVINLKKIAAAETCAPRNIGLLASAPQAWAKAMERDLIRRKENAEIVNEFVGSVKDRIEIEAKIKSIRYTEGDWGTTTIYTLVGTDNHLYKWYTSSDALGETADDTVYRLKGTVKKHEEYRDLKYTVLTRCKVLEEIKEEDAHAEAVHS